MGDGALAHRVRKLESWQMFIRRRTGSPWTAHAPLARFIDAMDRAVAASDNPSALAAQASVALVDLLAHPEAIGDEHRVSSDDDYLQHVVHVHPDGRYSLVALVWKPGQTTPIHDHRCWCVVGVMEGEEEERRYRLVEHDGEAVLVLTGTERHGRGAVSSLVPPDENIHLVSNSSVEADAVAARVRRRHRPVRQQHQPRLRLRHGPRGPVRRGDRCRPAAVLAHRR